MLFFFSTFHHLKMYTSYALLVICFFISSIQLGNGVKERSDSFSTVNVSDILNSIFRDYDKRIRPNYMGDPVEVDITMYVISVSSISEIKMDYTLDMYFRQYWKDSRLMYFPKYDIDYIPVDYETSNKMWTPDTFFANEKSAYFHMTTTPNTFTRIHKNGDVLKSTRLTITASCPMDLKYFPLDTQTCSLELESFGSNTKDIVYNWRGSSALGISPEVILPQFKFVGHRVKKIEIHLSNGNYSRLTCEFQFARSTGYYILQIYFPACLIVIASWVSFWLNRSNMLARVALSITTVLTITTLMSTVNAALPKLSYIKTSDVYLISCFLMVFAALIQQAVIEYVTRRNHQSNKKHNARANINVGHVKGSDLEKNHLELTNVSDDDNDNNSDGVRSSDIDKYSQIGFPIVFLVFNILYCIIYTIASNASDDNLIHAKN